MTTESFIKALQNLREDLNECLDLLSSEAKPVKTIFCQGMATEVDGHITRLGTNIVGGLGFYRRALFKYEEYKISTLYPLPVLVMIQSLLADSKLRLDAILATEPLTAIVLSEQLSPLSKQIFGASALLAGKSPEERLAEQSMVQPDGLGPSPMRYTPAPDPPPQLLLHSHIDCSLRVLPPSIFTPALSPRTAVTIALQFNAFSIFVRHLSARPRPVGRLWKWLGLDSSTKEPTETPVYNVVYGGSEYKEEYHSQLLIHDSGLDSVGHMVTSMGYLVRHLMNQTDKITSDYYVQLYVTLLRLQDQQY